MWFRFCGKRKGINGGMVELGFDEEGEESDEEGR